MPENTTRSNKVDLAGTNGRVLLVWGIPVAAMIISANTSSAIPNGIVFPIALVWMGLACLLNAFRCGRLHCFVTGPFFLLMAALSLLHATSSIPLGARGWEIIGYGTLIGAVVLWYGPESIWGKYVSRGAQD